MVEIPLPKSCISGDDKEDFVEEIIKWGKENLNDQENWRFKVIVLQSSKVLKRLSTANVIRFEIEDETDGMAIKLAFTQN